MELWLSLLGIAMALIDFLGLAHRMEQGLDTLRMKLRKLEHAFHSGTAGDLHLKVMAGVAGLAFSAMVVALVREFGGDTDLFALVFSCVVFGFAAAMWSVAFWVFFLSPFLLAALWVVGRSFHWMDRCRGGTWAALGLVLNIIALCIWGCPAER